MRSPDTRQDTLFSMIRPEDRVPKGHPLRPNREMINKALAAMNSDFEALYAHAGRASVLPEKLLRAQMLLILYTIRSDRQLMEQLNYNLLFRWFVCFSMEDEVWNHSTFTKNRDRLMEADIARKLFQQIVAQADAADLLSDEHFSVDGTLIEAWASTKSFRSKDGEEPPTGGDRNKEVDFHGQKRRNDTHESTTDPESHLFRKGVRKEAKLCYQGRTLMEHRHGLNVDARATQATGKSKREAAIDMVNAFAGTHRVTVSADKAYDTADFVGDLRCTNATPHIARNDTNRSSAIDGRTTRYPGCDINLRIRKMIEEWIGWGKRVGELRKTRFIGLEKTGFQFLLVFAGYNLVRMRNWGLRVPS